MLQYGPSMPERLIITLILHLIIFKPFFKYKNFPIKEVNIKQGYVPSPQLMTLGAKINKILKSIIPQSPIKVLINYINTN